MPAYQARDFSQAVETSQEYTPKVHTYDTAVKDLLNNLRNIRRDGEMNSLLLRWFERKADVLKDALFFFEVPENPRVLRRYFNWFSKLFFGGNLTLGNCKLRIIMAQGEDKAEWEQEHEAKGVLGYCRLVTTRRGRRRAHIIIYQDFELKDDPVAQLRNYLGTLAHEMLHAYLGMLPCECRECLTEPSISGWGYSGHGLPWMRASGALQRFCRETLKLAISLGRTESVAEELFESNKSTKDIPLAELDLNDGKLQIYLQRLSAGELEIPRDSEFVDYGEDFVAGCDDDEVGEQTECSDGEI